MGHDGSDEKILELITKLNVAVANVRIFPPAHHNVVDSVASAYATLTAFLQDVPQLSIIVVGDDLVANASRLRSIPGLRQFAAVLGERSIDRLTFLRGARQDDLGSFLLDLAAQDNTPIRSRSAIRLGKIEGMAESGEESAWDAGTGDDFCYEIDVEPHSPLVIRDSLEKETQVVCECIKQDQSLDLVALNEIIATVVHGSSQLTNPLQLLAEVKSFDEYTYVHMVNVCTLTMCQAEFLGFEGKNLRQVGLAAALHDVGKLFIPDEIINKPASLTKEEREIIETHPLKGVRYLMGRPDIPRLAVVCALEHHMRWDGKGYPRSETTWKPHIVSQMIAVADVFDAMRSKRPYKDPRPEADIVKVLIEGKGSNFNPFLVDNFLEIIGKFRDSDRDGDVNA